MSARFSPDGLYYWDGQQWRSTLSPDGRFRWSGSAWVATGYLAAPADEPQSRRAREATAWTRPLQYSVAGWYAISAVFSLTLPFWLGGYMSEAMNQSFQQQQARYPYASPPPPEFASMMTSFMGGVLWVSALFGFAICLLAIVGALNRWTWLYYAVMVLLGLGLIGVPFDVLNLAVGSNAFANGVVMPAWINWFGLISGVTGGALAIAMLYALVKRGPWGMTRRLPTAGQ